MRSRPNAVNWTMTMAATKPVTLKRKHALFHVTDSTDSVYFQEPLEPELPGGELPALGSHRPLGLQKSSRAGLHYDAAFNRFCKAVAQV